MLYASHTDEELLTLLKKGNEQAFTELYNRYWKLLFSIAYQKTEQPADAEEIVQDVFADLWKRRKKTVIQVSIKSYLAAATKFHIYDYWSDKQKALKQNVG